MADDAEDRVAQTRTSEEAIRSRVDELLAAMTTAEKAGQGEMTQRMLRRDRYTV